MGFHARQTRLQDGFIPCIRIPGDILPPILPAGASLRPLTARMIPLVAEVGRAIWIEHYVPIVGKAQVDYMVRLRFSADYLRGYLRRSDRWLDTLWLDDELVGYCSYSFLPDPAELKLEQLYLLPRHHGRGLGGAMMTHIEDRARGFRRPTIRLNVNKQNLGSIEIYRRSGFTICEEAVFDIGNAFVMDDYIMEKRLHPADPLPLRHRAPAMPERDRA